MKSRYILAVGLAEQAVPMLLDNVEKLGYQVISALSLNDASWIAAHRNFRLAVLDMDHLSKRGLQTFLDTVYQTPSMPIVVLNGTDDMWLSHVKKAIYLPSGVPFESALSTIVSILTEDQQHEIK